MFDHVNNKTDRMALIALQEKIEKEVEKLEQQEARADQDWKVSRPDWSKVNEFRAAKAAILAKYDHLMPEIHDPINDLYA